MCTPNQVLLMGAFETLDDVCRRHGITYWLEFGSALGAVRHQNVIPWDYDGDVGMLVDEYAKFVRVIATPEERAYLEAHDVRVDREAYGEPDACCFLKIVNDVHEELGIDVVAYKCTNDRIETTMSEQLQAEYPGVYAWPRDVIFPLDRVMFGGILAHLPSQFVLYLRTLYGDNFIDPDFADAALGCYARGSKPPFQMLSIMPSIKAGLRAEESDDAPFGVLRAQDSFVTEDVMWRMMAAETHDVYGYDKAENVVFVAGDKVQAMWERDALPCNIVDSLVGFSFSNERTEPVIALSALSVLQQVGYVATNSNGKYHMHIDPDDYGGGWMMLFQGTKVWWFVRPSDMRYLAAKGITIDTLAFKSFVQLVTLDDGYLWGKIIVAIAPPNTFIYFPPGCAHAVRTHERAAGLGGYAQRLT